MFYDEDALYRSRKFVSIGSVMDDYFFLFSTTTNQDQDQDQDQDRERINVNLNDET